ncbi:MAG: YceI family protein [Gammaproteobacteria bacterium]
MAAYSRAALRAGSFLAMMLPLLILSTSAAVAAAAAPPVHYTLDAARSLLRFQFVQAGATNSGRFGKFTADVLFSPENLAASKIDVTVGITSLDTGDKERDDTLKGADLFNVAKFPTAHFVATKFTPSTGTGLYNSVGKLTIRDATKSLTMPLTFQIKTEQGKSVGYLTGRVTLKRLEYGVGQGEWKSVEWVKDDVNVTFSLRLVAAP